MPLTIPPHLKRIVTLPCEISAYSRSRHAQELREANCHARLKHVMQDSAAQIVVEKNTHLVMRASFN